MDGPATGRGWAAACHLAALIVWVGVPLGNLVGPLLIWLLKKDEFPLVDDQGREALNFQLSLTAYGLAVFLLAGLLFVAFLVGGSRGEAEFAVAGGAALAVVLVVGGLLALVSTILTIVAAIRASNGQRFRYPLTMRLLK